MLFNCRTFKVFGDGNNKMILIATDSDGKQEAFIIHNPMISSFSITNNTTAVDTFYGERHYKQGRSQTTLELVAGECELHQGINLDKQFDPTWTKSIKELFSIIDNKLDER